MLGLGRSEVEAVKDRRSGAVVDRTVGGMLGEPNSKGWERAMDDSGQQIRSPDTLLGQGMLHQSVFELGSLARRPP